MKVNYHSLLNRLLQVNLHGGMKLGLENCRMLDQLLQNPSHAFPVIHIAGTNGKGSVSTKIASSYEAAGKKTGLYTSPHISCFRERIQISSQLISEELVVKYLIKLFSLCDEYHIKATFFELTTMMALLHFAENEVDIAILETGLGGRLDATNIVSPLLSIITSISLEHTEILGSTIEEIATEKAGIIKQNIPVIIGPSVPKQVIAPIALQKNAYLNQVRGDFSDFHEENTAIARCALKFLNVDQRAIEKRISALPTCRMETWTKTELMLLKPNHNFPQAIILDVAHNPSGMQKLIEALRKQYPDASFRFLIGLSKNKDIKACLGILQTIATGFHLVESNSERALSSHKISQVLLELGISKDLIFCELSIAIGMQHACNLAAKNNELLVVCGTFFIMGEARKEIGILEPVDCVNLNEVNTSKHR